MNIITRELRSSVKSIIIWLLAFLFMSYAAIVKYESIITTGPEVIKLLDSFPRVVLALFNMVDTDITTLPGYFAIIASYLLIMSASHGMFFGIKLFAREEQDKTADFLLVKPRSRARIFLNKVTAGLLVIAFLQVGLFIINRFALKPYLPEAKALLLNYSLAFLAVHLLFFALGVCLISISSRKRVETLGLGIILVSYFVPVIVNLSDKLAYLRDYFPFNTFLHPEMAEVNGTPFLKLGIIFGITLLALSVGLRAFRKKDILT